MSSKTLALWHLHVREARPATPGAPPLLAHWVTAILHTLRRFFETDPMMPAVAFRNRRS